MKFTRRQAREEARRLYLTGEAETNAEIAARIGTKPHTIGKWRRDEDWDDLRRKADRRAAEKLVEQIANDRMTLNLQHYRVWEVLLGQLIAALKAHDYDKIPALLQAASLLDKTQKGQRLAKGLSATGETEEEIRAEAEAEIRKLIDAFIDSVKENVADEAIRDRIRRCIIGVASPQDQ